MDGELIKWSELHERRGPEPLSPKWKAEVEENIKAAFEEYEWLSPINVAPASLVEGETRGLPELTTEEQNFIKGVLFREIGFEPANPTLIGNYDMDAPEGANWQGAAVVRVYQTAYSADRDMFLHEIHFPDGKVDFIVAPQDFRL